MSGEIKKIHEMVLEEKALNPGQMVEMDTPAGPIQLIGMERAFALRRPNSKVADIVYDNGQSLTINYENGRIVKITAVAPEDWQANDMLDPML